MKSIMKPIISVSAIILGLVVISSHVFFTQTKSHGVKLHGNTTQYQKKNAAWFDEVQYQRILQAIDVYGLGRNAEIEFQKIEKLIKEYRYNEAIVLLDNLIKKTYTTPISRTRIFLLKGKVYFKDLNQTTTALEEIKKAANICPDTKIKLRIYYFLALVYDFIDPDQAILYYKNILNEDFEIAEELYIPSSMGLSFLYLRHEEFQSAMTHLVDAFIKYSELGGIQEDEQYSLDEICEKYPIAEQNRKLCENFIEKYPEHEQECLKAFYTLAKKYELHRNKK